MLFDRPKSQLQNSVFQYTHHSFYEQKTVCYACGNPHQELTCSFTAVVKALL